MTQDAITLGSWKWRGSVGGLLLVVQAIAVAFSLGAPVPNWQKWAWCASALAADMTGLLIALRTFAGEDRRTSFSWLSAWSGRRQFEQARRRPHWPGSIPFLMSVAGVSLANGLSSHPEADFLLSLWLCCVFGFVLTFMLGMSLTLGASELRRSSQTP